MYEDKTPENIKKDIMSELKTDIDKREGSFADDMAGPLAVEASKVYSSLNAVHPIVWVNETSGPYLDDAAADIGIEPRKEGTKAKVMLQITGRVGFIIEEGTVFLTGDDLFFLTLAPIGIPEDAPAQVEAEAKEVGKKYNVHSGEIIYAMTNDSRIDSVANPEPAMGGSDPESGASLYARIVQARQRPPTSGNRSHYEQWALEVDGVGNAYCIPTWNGPGTVKVIIADDERMPVDEVIVQRCWDHIEEKRPIGPEVTVVSVTGVPIDISASIKPKGDIDQSEAETNIIAALGAYLQVIPLEYYQVRYNHIGAVLMGVEEVLDYDDLLLGGAVQNIPLTDEQVPVLGEVLITWI